MVTLPYSASASWVYHLYLPPSSLYWFNLDLGNKTPGGPLLKGTNGAGARIGIAASTLPGVWLKLPATITVGDRVTATATAFGGYVQPAVGARWIAAPAPAGGPAFAEGLNYKLTFTFTAPFTGNIVVAYNEADYDPNRRFAAAVVDPRVCPRPTPVPTAPRAPLPTALPTAAPTPDPTPTETPLPPVPSPTLGDVALAPGAPPSFATAAPLAPIEDGPALEPARTDGWGAWMLLIGGLGLGLGGGAALVWVRRKQAGANAAGERPDREGSQGSNGQA